MNNLVPKILIAMVLLFFLINFIGWFTKPEGYKSPSRYGFLLKNTYHT